MMPRFLTLASGWREAVFAMNGKPGEEGALFKKMCFIHGKRTGYFSSLVYLWGGR